MRALLFLAALATSAGCLRSTVYKCATSDQCGGGGICEDTGFCSFADSLCAGMGDRRYSEQSGIYANKCVGGVIFPGEDMQIITDDVPTDVPPDVPIVGNCPGNYAAVSGQTNLYLVITAANDWPTQVAACMGTGRYLFVPNDQTELTAILNAANVDIWAGATDEANEGTFVTTNGGTLASNSPLWDATDTEPDNDPEMGTGNNNSHCVVALNALDRLADDKCANTYAAVCECQP